jgi:glycosyltransferase involved in cell wall biosynthesis
MKQPQAQILLSVFNGEKFLSAQLKSIQTQSFQDWVCYIRDDSSQDSSLKIIQEFCATDSRFIPVKDTLGNLGSIYSFEQLLKTCEFQCPIFFCDQDDIWLEDKLKIFLAAASSQKKTHWAISSDLFLIDDTSKLKSSSFHNQLGYQARNLSLPQILAQNIFPGCSLCFSFSMKAAALPFPKVIPMHDWWIVLLSMALGELTYLPQPLVAYRQHQQQVSGGVGEASFFKKSKRAFGSSKRNLFHTLLERLLLWKFFVQRLHLLGQSSSFLERLSDLLLQKEPFAALFNILRLKIKMHGFLRQFLFLLGIFFYWKKLQKKLEVSGS